MNQINNKDLLGSSGFPGSSAGKESTSNAGIELGSIPSLEISPGGGISYPLQYSCLENPVDRGTWPAIVHGVVKSQLDTTEQLRTALCSSGNSKKRIF